MNKFLSMPNDNMDVLVRIVKQGSCYQAYIIGQHKTEKDNESQLMHTSEPISRMLLEQLLESFGFHQRDVFDALDIGDGESVIIKHPLW
ncbi:MAG: hypothetical protein AB8C40_00220 [Gammaproteobacteria bacterium]